MASRENHQHFQHDNVFSEYGDIDRMTGDGTSERSREANALAAATERNVPEYGRANAQAGAGGSVGDEALQHHAYGSS